MSSLRITTAPFFGISLSSDMASSTRLPRTRLATTRILRGDIRTWRTTALASIKPSSSQGLAALAHNTEQGASVYHETPIRSSPFGLYLPPVAGLAGAAAGAAARAAPGGAGGAPGARAPRA